MSGKDPWKTHDQRVMYDNPWIRVTEYQVTHPSGDPGRYGVVDMKHVATGVVVLDGDHTWLVGQWRYTLGQYSWEIPEGGAAPGEDPLDAAKRELREETGLEAEHWRPLMTLHTSNSVTSERAEIFVAEGVKQVGAPQPEASEDLNVIRIPLAEALARVIRGEVTDAVSVAGLLRVVGGG